MNAWLEPERLDRGLVIVLPGIDGRSFLNCGIARGLNDAGIPYAIEIDDWTSGPLWGIYNLRSRKLHTAQAARLREKILKYREQYPGRPIFLVGHSAGGALALIIAAELPENVQLTGIILIVPAISPSYDTGPALKHCDRGIWNYRSWGDCIYLGILTTIFGTVDGRHVPAAGALGFPKSVDPRLRDVPYRFAMLRDANFGGHLSCTNRRFVRKWIAPLIAELTPDEKISD